MTLPHTNDERDSSTLDWDDVPIFNEDLETAELLPASVRRVREAVAVADAVIIASPECASSSYRRQQRADRLQDNYSIPGPLKNLVDWLSRPYDRDGNLTRAADGLVPLSGKIVAICGLHPSPSGACALVRGGRAHRIQVPPRLAARWLYARSVPEASFAAA
jgi:chromate reductase